MKKIILYIITFLITIIIDALCISMFIYNTNLDIQGIKLLEYDEDNNIIKIQIEKSNPILFTYEFKCTVKDDENTYEVTSVDNICTFELPINADYQISIQNKYKTTEFVRLLDYIENKVDFKFGKDTYYLAIDESQEITYEDTYILPADILYEFYCEDESICKIEDDKIVGISAGETKLRIKNYDDYATIIVTDLISNYHLSETKKDVVPCGVYTEDEAELLDTLLEYYVNEAGYGTRAGAVAAGRFLTLQFKYRVPYFYENGRTNDSGVHMADGEGRYYKKGLYLSESKYADLTYIYKGPAMWGCPLYNGSTNAKYGFIAGNKMPNGLDCSGFVSWALVNGGFDPGDVGAGENEGIYQLTDTGEFTTLTTELVYSGKIKTGDLFNFWGHIALIIGQDDTYYYVAESLPHLGGVIAKKYPKSTVASHFEFVVLMDSFYGEDGNLTDYWE